MDKTKIKEDLFAYLTYLGFDKIEEDDHIKFIKKIVMPGKHIVFNGKRWDEPGEEKTLEVGYLGECSMYNVGDEETPIFGFSLPGSDIWVDGVNDLQFWMDIYLKQM